MANFIKFVDPKLYEQYLLERYKKILLHSQFVQGIQQGIYILDLQMIPNKAEFVEMAYEFYLQEFKRKKIIP